MTIESNPIRRRILVPLGQFEPEKSFAEELKELHLSIMGQDKKEVDTPLAGGQLPKAMYAEGTLSEGKGVHVGWWHGIG